ncbi:MAG: Fic family protein [Saprospiraceae bacterium]
MLQTIKELTRWAEELSKLELLQEIDQLKAEVDSHRPISREIQDRIFQKFRLDWNYNSNAIEGNKLTYGETVALLMHGVTAKGKPLKDHLDVKGHNKGINLLLDIVKSERDFTQNDIRSLHEIILVESYSSKTITPDGIPATRNIQIGQYKTVPNHVKTVTGEMHYYATPEETPILVDELMNWYEASKTNDKIHPFIVASLFHYRFVAIHPFDDGNGRMTRILMNLILMRNHYPPIVVPLQLREKYYGVLSEADSEDYLPMTEYFGELLIKSLNTQLKGIRGESLAEPSDINKKIELFRKSISNKRLQEAKKSKLNELNFSKFLRTSIIPLIIELYKHCLKFDDLFSDKQSKISFWNPKITDATTNISIDNLKEISEHKIWDSSHLFTKITFKYLWFRFNESEAKLNIDTAITIDLKDKNYLISYGNKELKKDYIQSLSNKEIHNITDYLISEVIKEIQQKSNQQ